MRPAFAARNWGRRLALAMQLCMLGGCATVIKEQVENDITLAQACQKIQANQAGYVATSKEAYIELVKNRVLGEVVRCGATAGTSFGKPELQSVLLCGINEDVLNAIPASSMRLSQFRKDVTGELTAIKAGVGRIKENLQLLQAAWTVPGVSCGRVDGCAREYSKIMANPVNVKAGSDILASLEYIREHMENIEEYATIAERDILAQGQQDQLQVLADAKRFVVNAKTFLTTSRRALLGDVAMATRDAILNNIYYQLSHRILDSLDTSMGRVEKLIDKADDKLYGVLSLSMVGARSTIQKNFDTAITSAMCKASDGQPPPRAALALAQAVCERINNAAGSGKSYLAPMIEASFVKAVENGVRQAGTTERVMDKECARKPGVTAGIMTDPKDIAAPVTEDASAFGLYMAHEWAAGIALTKVTTVAPAGVAYQPPALQLSKAAPASLILPPAPAGMTAVAAAVPVQLHLSPGPVFMKLGLKQPAPGMTTASLAATGDGSTQPDAASAPEKARPLALAPGAGDSHLVAAVPERAAVERLALASSSAAITEFEAGRERGNVDAVSEHLVDASSVKTVLNTFVSTQYQSVQVNVTSNNTQNVTVTPGATPPVQNVIIVPRSLPALSEPDLCDSFPSGTGCSRRTNGSYEIEARGFDSGSFRDPDVANLIALIGKASGKQARAFDAYISGYASTSEFACHQISAWRGVGGSASLFPGARVSSPGRDNYRIAYRSSGGRVAADASCDGKRQADGNYMLSFARAAWVSSLLETASGAQIRTADVAGMGANYVRQQDLAADRRIVIRLFPH